MTKIELFFTLNLEKKNIDLPTDPFLIFFWLLLQTKIFLRMASTPSTPTPALNVQRTEELCAVRKNMVTRSATDTEVIKHANQVFQSAWIGTTRRCVHTHPHKWSNRRNKH
ncbi:hypothetical protein AALO_G00301290 [Alosa alosa]|uniref:Uncharacterized protein n=1 Tax=Alosa alosa TaxID=278164 RepID=A0AAV6FHQ9_9TELE|nr:hypothetical protein AALO_G00301290 [Alosa alosa]